MQLQYPSQNYFLLKTQCMKFVDQLTHLLTRHGDGYFQAFFRLIGNNNVLLCNNNQTPATLSAINYRLTSPHYTSSFVGRSLSNPTTLIPSSFSINNSACFEFEEDEHSEGLHFHSQLIEKLL